MNTRANPPEISKWERIPVLIFAQPRQAAVTVAQEIATLIRERAREGRRAVIGLATGSTPIFVYQELVRLHREEGLSFRHVTIFNLDEYYPMAPDRPQSYRHFMQEHLFDHIDIDPGETHVPDGTLPREEVTAACAAYEARIEKMGGLDFQLLGIGRTGHIGFNEPGSPRRSATRFIRLDRLTRLDALKDFQSEEQVPRTAITMGVRTILQARRIVILALGEHKAAIVARTVEGEISADVPATYLQDHDNCLMVLDAAASSALTRVRTPWIVGSLEEQGLSWNDAMIRRAVTWLAAETGKAVLKLTDEDYNSHELQDLLAAHGNAYELNLRVFRQLQNTITGWPGGKPAPDDRRAAAQPKPLAGSSSVFPKRILIFASQPGHALCSIGGTITRLAAQGHEVHIAYFVSGGANVNEEMVRRYLDFCRSVGLPAPAGDLKGAIRRAESQAAARVCGLPDGRLHSLDLPLHETARDARRDFTAADVEATRALLERIDPHQVYAGGELASPYAIDRLAHELLGRALAAWGGTDRAEGCGVWLYRGAWTAWPIHEIDMAVPLSPDEVACKRQAVAQHESQRHRAPFRAPEGEHAADVHSHANSRLFDALGLADYEAIETFRRWENL